jgi:molybdenum cofactor cytidylyltransferase
VIVGLLLAGGGARRFGSQKLVAPFDGKPLVRHAAESLAHATDDLIVVVGSDAAAVTEALGDIEARIVENPDWGRGLSSSIRCGVAATPPEAEALVITLGDEPLVSASAIRAVVATWRQTGQPIVVARYAGENGHPVLFAASTFGELSALEGDAGAKRVINRAPDRVAHVDVADTPPLDIDEPDDLRRLGGAIW